MAREVKIDVPWGHISGKIWGDEKNSKVLCFHGIMDNAASFNRLIPYLPNHFCYVAIDLPGHGFSSHFPPNLPVYSFNYIPAYKIITEYFKQEKYIFMGHSFGGQIAYLFAQLYPEYVEKIVLLDTISFYPVSTRMFRDYLTDHFDEYLNLEEKLKNGKPPSYTYEDALDKLQTNRRYSPIKLETAKALMERSVVSTEDGKYRYTIDPRIRNWINPVRDFRYTIETFKYCPVTCPILIILAKESNAQEVFMMPVIKKLKGKKNVLFKYVEGHHDVHGDHPERVAPFIVKFLTQKIAKL